MMAIQKPIHASISRGRRRTLFLEFRVEVDTLNLFKLLTISRIYLLLWAPSQPIFDDIGL